eukprot:COSAG03_NODE_25324_length_266_cov_0.874251_1_plen_50_part_10
MTIDATPVRDDGREYELESTGDESRPRCVALFPAPLISSPKTDRPLWSSG